MKETQKLNKPVCQPWAGILFWFMMIETSFWAGCWIVSASQRNVSKHQKSLFSLTAGIKTVL